MRSAMAAKAAAASLSGSAATIGSAGVAALAQRRHQRHLAEQRDLEPLGQLLAAAGAEQLVARAVVAGEPRHVLDDALDLEVDLLGHEGGPLGDPLGRGLRRGHDVDLAAGQELRQRQGDVAGARAAGR